MKNKSLKKLGSSLVIACLLFSSFGVAFGASTSVKSDIKGHWAEAQISAWIDKGLIKGYDDGRFKPENPITRAEFITLINRSFGFTEIAEIKFRDVASDNWAYTEVAKAVKVGYITGYADGTIGVSKQISRQEAAVIVSRLLKSQATDNAAAASFLDASKFASWSKDAIGAVVAEEIMQGYDADDTFKPEASITRAEAVVTLERASIVHADAAATVTYNAAGDYGPTTGIETINKNVVVNVSGVTLQNMVINGDLLLGEGIGNGDAFLENVKVTGKVTVQGGGENSIHFNNSVLLNIIIDKKSGAGIVRIVSEGTTTVALVIVNSPANIQENNSTGDGFGNVDMGPALPANAKVTLQGSFHTVNVSSQQIQVDVTEGTIQHVNANSTATGMSLNLSPSATINSLVLDAVVKMLGQGTIVRATMNINGSTFERPAKTTITMPVPTPTAYPVQTAPPTAPQAPTYTYDYVLNSTVQLVPAMDEYSTDNFDTPGIIGQNDHVTITPGSTMYFRTLATSSSLRSATQTLTVHAIPVAPDYTYNSVSGTTTQVVPSTDEYSMDNFTNSWSSGEGETIQLTPGTTIYFRTTGTINSFASEIQTLSIPLPVSNLAATIGDQRASFTFDAPTEATSVELQISTDGTNYTTATTEALEASSTTATATGLVNGTEYSFRLAVIGGPHAGTSNVVTASPAVAISNLTAIVSGGQVTFTFSAAAGATSVILEQSMDGTNYTHATTGVLDASSTTATAAGLTPSMPYSFRLVVVGGPHAGISNVESAMIPMPMFPF
jgi:hypothetical protein